MPSYVRVEKKYGVGNTDCNHRNPPNSDAASTEDSPKNEGFLKSAWHKLTNQSKCSDSNQPGEQGKKEDGQTSDKNDQKNNDNDNKTGNNEEKKSSGSS